MKTDVVEIEIAGGPVPLTRDGGRGDFEATMLPHLDAAYNLARWLTRDADKARDLVQDAYLRALRFYDSYRGGSAKAWLLEIVRNTCIDGRRKEARRGLSVEFDEASHSDPAAPDPPGRLAAARAEILRRCIELLPAPFQEILVLRELEELPYAEIAQVTVLPMGTVMSRLSRARKRLEECAVARSAETAP